MNDGKELNKTSGDSSTEDDLKNKEITVLQDDITPFCHNDSDNEKKNVIIQSEIIIKPAHINLAENDNNIADKHNSSDINLEKSDPENSIKSAVSLSVEESGNLIETNLTVKSLDVKSEINVPDIKNSSLGLLQFQYSDSCSDIESDNDHSKTTKNEEVESDTNSNDSEAVVINDQEYRDQIVEIDSDSSSSDTDIELVSEDIRTKITGFENNEDDIEDDDCVGSQKKWNDPLRVKGELFVHELPPIQDLLITVPEEECVELGKIHSIVDQLVLVDSIPGTVPLNLETVLFLDKGHKVLGEIFDVLGQVTNPLYCIRFNSSKQIVEKGIEPGQIVYVAPRTEHTHFVILSSIMKNRGSDASWKNDVEPSPRHIDFSDDEEERNYRRSLANKEHNNRSDEKVEQKKRTRAFSSTSSQISDSPSNTGHNYNSRGRGNNRFSRPYRHYNAQFQPRNQPLYNNVRLQNPPTYNYDLYNNSWHSNYNFNNNIDSSGRNTNNPNQWQNHLAGESQTSSMNYNQHINNQENYSQQQMHQNYNITDSTSSSLYPNPYAIRPTFMQNNIQHQFFHPPPPPPSQ